MNRTLHCGLAVTLGVLVFCFWRGEAGGLDSGSGVVQPRIVTGSDASPRLAAPKQPEASGQNGGAAAKPFKTSRPAADQAIAGNPYGGTPHAIPGRIEAEDYDLGGEGVGYHDLSPGNAGSNYRTDDVDIKPSGDAGGGYVIGWFQAGEWLEYTVNVAQTALYDIELRFGSIYGLPNEPNRTLSVTFDGTNVTGAVVAPLVAGWDTYLLTVTVRNVPLTAGQHAMRIVVGQPEDWVDLNWINFIRHRPGTLLQLKGR